ncbi:MAG TPA: hypothetical protein VLH58_10020 [Candidatus Methylomirabilis sp.]|nr:hypothetical protein [Candidatus Methylomirabilis sp.]
MLNPTMPDPRVQLILDTIFRDMKTPQSERDALTDWLLDTQPRTASLEIGVLLSYMTTQQPDLLKQLKDNWRVKEALATALAST